jgi:hypothetical protein
MSSKLNLGLSLIALALGAGCAASPAKVAWANGPATCPGGSVEGDAALGAYAGCQRVTGNLVLRGVSTLAPLAALTRVDGTLGVEKSDLESLEGLEALRSVESLSLRDNAELDDISSLSALNRAVRVELRNNPGLTAPEGLSGLTEVDEIVIEHNGFLTLKGLDGLERVGHAEIRGNAKLISVSALNGVRRLDSLVLQGNPRICGKLGVFAGILTPPRELTAGKNHALRASEIEHLRPANAGRQLAMR